MTSWKLGVVAVAAAAFFWGGYRYAAALYQADIDQMRSEHALALAEKQKEISANASKQNAAYATAIDELEKTKAELAESRVDSGSLRVELERVRHEANSYRARLPATGANAGKHFSERLERCVGLLEEGSELSAEGADLSQRLSGKHDALVKLVSP